MATPLVLLSMRGLEGDNMRSLCRYILMALIVGALFGVQAFLSSRPFAEAKVIGNALNNLQEKQLEMYREFYALLTTLATATIGAVGAFLFNRYKSGPVPRAQRYRAIAVVVLCAHESVLWMLQQQFFNLTTHRVLWMTRLQVWIFLASLVVLLEFFAGGLGQEES